MMALQSVVSFSHPHSYLLLEVEAVQNHAPLQVNQQRPPVHVQHHQQAAVV